MAVSRVTGQTANSSGTGTSRAPAFPGNTTTGNLIVVYVSRSGASAGVSVTSVTDPQGNTYVQAVGSAETAAGRNCEIWYAKNITGGTTPTVTVNFSASVTSVVAIEELQGASTTAPLDTFDTFGSASTVTALKGSNAGISSSTSGVYGSQVSVTETGGQTFTAGGSWTQSPTIGGRSYFAVQAAAGSISSDTGAHTASTTTIYRSCMAIWKPDASGQPTIRRFGGVPYAASMTPPFREGMQVY